MVQEQNEIIGRRLQDVRESAHMDFYDMAKLLRVSVGHYRKIERGVYGLDVEKLVILYEKLDVDPLYLLAGRQVTAHHSDAQGDDDTRTVAQMDIAVTARCLHPKQIGVQTFSIIIVLTDKNTVSDMPVGY